LPEGGGGGLKAGHALSLSFDLAISTISDSNLEPGGGIGGRERELEVEVEVEVEYVVKELDPLLRILWEFQNRGAGGCGHREMGGDRGKFVSVVSVRQHILKSPLYIDFKEYIY
jgi:hypothetical protein